MKQTKFLLNVPTNVPLPDEIDFISTNVPLPDDSDFISNNVVDIYNNNKNKSNSTNLPLLPNI